MTPSHASDTSHLPWPTQPGDALSLWPQSPLLPLGTNDSCCSPRPFFGGWGGTFHVAGLGLVTCLEEIEEEPKYITQLQILPEVR